MHHRPDCRRPIGPTGRRAVALPALALLWALAVAGCSYVPTAADRAVETPRMGRVLAPADAPARATPLGVAVVYSSREDINVKSRWEQWHDYDLHKGRRIYHQLVADGAVKPEDVFVPAPADDALLLAVHDRHYLDALNDRQFVARQIGSKFPRWLSDRQHREGVLAASRAAVGGTVMAGELAAAHGLAIHLGGGFSHAFRDRGGQVSLLADVPAAIVSLRQRKLARRVLVIDVGALQANGVAAALADDPDARLLDFYERNNYPPTKQPNPDGVPLDDRMGNSDYQVLLERHLPPLLDEFKPDMVFLLAGVDTVRNDPVGRSALTLDYLADRDLYIADQVRRRAIPLCVVLDGGWAPDSWQLHYRSIRALLARYGGVPFGPQRR